MLEYLNKHIVISVVKDNAKNLIDKNKPTIDVVNYTQELIRLIENMPSEEGKPIKYGYWIRHGDGSVTCSVCGRRLSDVIYGYPYSACCGSRMDLEKE